MSTPKPEPQPRTADGCYDHTLDRPCRCGHTKGEHTAERLKIDGEWLQECCADDCSCQRFMAARRRRS